MTAPFPDWIHPDGHRRDLTEILTHHQLLTWDIRPGEKVIIIGGYNGATVRFILDRYPEAEIYTFEPQPWFYESLVSQFAAYPNVHVYPYGLGNRTGTFPMTRAGSDMASFLTGEEAMLGYSEPDSEGELREFAAVMDDLGIGELAWFHSNCEQYEYILFPHLLRIGWLPKIGQLVIATHGYPEGNPDARPWVEIMAGIEQTHERMWIGTPHVHQWWAWSRADRVVRDVRADLIAAGVDFGD